MRPQNWRAAGAGVAGFVALLILASSASAASSRQALLLPLSQLRAAAGQYAPGAILPTRVPPGINQADVGAFCSAPGVGGPPCRWMLGYSSKSTGAEAFHL